MTINHLKRAWLISALKALSKEGKGNKYLLERIKAIIKEGIG